MGSTYPIRLKGACFVNEVMWVVELPYSLSHGNEMMIERTEINKDLHRRAWYELVHRPVEQARCHP